MGKTKSEAFNLACHDDRRRFPQALCCPLGNYLVCIVHTIAVFHRPSGGREEVFCRNLVAVRALRYAYQR
jgi:hypothetical protein